MVNRLRANGIHIVSNRLTLRMYKTRTNTIMAGKSASNLCRNDYRAVK